MKQFVFFLMGILSIGLLGCSEGEEVNLKNDLIKKSMAPLVVGERVQFSYAAGTTESTLESFKAIASFPGAVGTNFEPYTWHTENGQDISTIVANDCYTDGNTSIATIIEDVKSTTLRYYYVIPSELKGKQVSFSFFATSKDGETVSLSTQAYQVSLMDMKTKISLDSNGACYFSIEDMKAYTKDEVISSNLMDKIDFIYAYAATKTVGTNNYVYKHAFFAPGATSYYPDNFSIPSNWSAKNTLMEKRLYVWDGQLKEDVHTSIYVDDVDLKSAKFDNAANGVLDLKVDGGVFMKSDDGKHVAYIYVNSLDDAHGTAVIGIKKIQI